MPTRYALYYSPVRDHPLTQFGASWLGWDLENGCEVSHADIADLPLTIAELTAIPRKYGFHATLKAPFFLTPNYTEKDLRVAVANFAKRRKAFDIGLMQVTNLGGFAALTQITPNPQVDLFAADCVIELDAARAPLSPDEITRRTRSGLNARQTELLLAWGYPYTMEEFRFHMTLTGPLPPKNAELVQSVLSNRLAPILAEPIALNNLCLCGQAEDGRFRIINRYALAG